MSNYPFSFDNNITLPGVSGSTQEDVAIMALRSAVFAIETELGVTPSGVYPDVRTRLDILEARIQNGINPNIPNDGYVKSPLYIWNVPQSVILSISDGYGAPTENRLDGSLYMRGGDGYANNQLYVRLNGQWLPVQTEQFTATNDLAGFPPGSDGHLAQTVVGLYNHPFNPSMDLVGSIEDGYHVTWNNSLSEWEAQTGFIPTHDLAAFSGPYGRTGQIVTGIQGSHVSPTPPLDKQSLIWVVPDAAWVPQATPIIFTDSSVLNDGYTLRTNIASNKLLQSPSVPNTGRIGMVNFGSRSTGASTGVTDNYSAILSGDRHSVSGPYGVAVAGDSHTVSAQYAAVLAGLTNTTSGQYSIVGNGTNNLASQTQSTVLNGTSNTSSGANSTVGNGTNNSATADFSTILNGATNTISVGSIHTLIGSGHDNQIIGGLSSEHSIILGGDNNIVNSANNVFMGTPTNSSSLGDFSVILSGTSNTISALSDYATILTGNNNIITAPSSEYAFIGVGQNNTISGAGHFSTILSADSGTANGDHATVLKGFNNSSTGQFTTVINGQNNTVNSPGWGLILDGYSNSITGTGSFIADGYSNSVSGFFSSIINGNTNIIAGRNSTILNGANNNIDSPSAESTVLVGSNNIFINSANTTAAGSGNTFTNAAQTFVIGTTNSIQSTASFINGSTNTLAAGSSFNRMFGSFNTLGTNAATNFIVGNGNNIGASATTTGTFSFGSNNIIDGALGSSVNGSSNISTASVTNIHGQFGKARMYGQEVRANSRFTQTTIAVGSNNQVLNPVVSTTINVVSTTGFPNTGTIAVITTSGLQTVSYTSINPTQFNGCLGGSGTLSTGGQVGKIGEAQWSRLILTGSSTGGNVIQLQLQDSVAANPTFVDGYSYDMSIKLLIVNTSPLSPNPVVPARHYIDVLAHQESGVLIIDNVNFTVSTPNTSDSPTRTPWTVTVTAVGNQLLLFVDLESITSYVQPSNTPSNRRAIATIDMREISRI
jgi:hypothetical protein